MERLTDRRTAAELKANADGLRAAGLEPTISDLRYIKLAEYENREERERSERYLKYDPFLAARFIEIRRLNENDVEYKKPTILHY